MSSSVLSLKTSCIFEIIDAPEILEICSGPYVIPLELQEKIKHILQKIEKCLKSQSDFQAALEKKPHLALYLIKKYSEHLNLHYAPETLYSKLARYGISPLFEYLSNAGDFTFSSKFIPSNYPALHRASLSGNIILVRHLIKKCGLDPLSLTMHRETILHTGARSGNMKLVAYLIEELDLDPNASTLSGQTVLHHAAMSGNKDLVVYLIEKLHLNPKATTTDGKTLLHFAAESGNKDLVEYLIDKFELDPKATTSHRDTVLHFAAESGNIDLFEFLIDKFGLDLLAPNMANQTPLFFAGCAACCGHQKIFEYLIKNLKKLHLTPDIDIISFAISSGNIELIEYLIDNFEIKVNDQTVFVALLGACSKGNKIFIEYLKEKFGFSCLDTPDKQFKILIRAAIKGHKEVLKYLIEECGLNHLQNEDGYSLLHFAAISGNQETVEYLIKTWNLLPSSFSHLKFSVKDFAIFSENLQLIDWMGSFSESFHS